MSEHKIELVRQYLIGGLSVFETEQSEQLLAHDHMKGYRRALEDVLSFVENVQNKEEWNV